MKVLSFLNLKGGVAKTISAINTAHILGTVYDKRVLIVDNDKQGNITKFFDLYSYERPSISEILTIKGFETRKAINTTLYKNIDLIGANMNLLYANKVVLMDSVRQQQTILLKALRQVESQYDYCIIDNAPDLCISVINGLVASHDVIVPIKIDQFSFDGIEILAEQFEELKEFNPGLTFKGCLVTQYAKNSLNAQGIEYLNNKTQYPIFKTCIRRTVKIDESTFQGKPIVQLSKNCLAAKDYLSFVKEYLGE